MRTFCSSCSKQKESECLLLPRRMHLFFTGLSGAAGSAGTETIEGYGEIPFEAEDTPFY